MELKLTSKEKSELFIEILLTFIFLLTINFAVYIILNEWVRHVNKITGGIFAVKMSFALGANNIKFGNWGLLFAFIMGVLDTFTIYWRGIHQYHQIQMYHIISELHYIASGNFDHRIPFVVNGPMQPIVESVNKLVDSAVQAMEDEKRVEKSKDELIANISHDIRTPLTSIIGYLGLLENHQYRSEEDLNKFTHVVYTKSKQMKSMVDDLFEYTKVSQEKRPLDLVQISLTALFEQLQADFELKAKQSGMEISVRMPDGDIQIEVDPKEFVRIFDNLLTNALKYGKDGKNIFISAYRVDSNEIEIQVANDGERIPADALSKIFERFYRVEKSRNKDTGGTGLGLSIAQRIVQLHHGTIEVQSNRKLTTFKMRFPIKQP